MKSFPGGLILGSTSSFRQALMDSTGLPYRSVSPGVDEKSVLGSTPKDTARLRARAKALNVARENPTALVIGCDQVLGMGTEVFDKAETLDEARTRLRMFAGNSHFLYSAVCLSSDQVLVEEFVVPVAVKMRELSEAAIEKYLSTGEWQGCVGCYRIEGKGIHLMENIEADWSSIIGLPLVALLAALRRAGFDWLEA